MVSQVFAVLALLAVAKAALIPDVHVIAEHEAPAQYKFGYQVSDPVTGDEKHQEETRDGDVVHGSYSLVESDGTRRVVEYTADDVNGFNAVVHKEPAANHVVAAPAAHHVVATPAVHHVAAAPVAHHVVAAPIARHVVAAPVAHPVAYSPYVSTRVSSLPTLNAYSGLYSPYHSYNHPVYSPYNNLRSYVF